MDNFAVVEQLTTYKSKPALTKHSGGTSEDENEIKINTGSTNDLSQPPSMD